MTFAAPAVAPLAKGLSVATSHTAPKATAAPTTEAPKSSAGEVSAGNLRTETARAIDAASQSAVAPRLRDQETVERSKRLPPRLDAPTGPPPAFDESVLERRSRTAFDPPDAAVKTETEPPKEDADDDDTSAPFPVESKSDTPPNPREKAEAGFAETRAISDDAKLATLNVKG